MVEADEHRKRVVVQVAEADDVALAARGVADDGAVVLPGHGVERGRVAERLPDQPRVERAAGADEAVGARQHDVAVADVHLLVEARQFLRIDRHLDHAIELAIGRQQLSCELQGGAAGGAPDDRPADEQIVAPGVELGAEVVAIRHVDGAGRGEERRFARHPLCVDPADEEGQLVHLDPFGRPFNQVQAPAMLGVGRARRQQDLVDPRDDPLGVLVERLREQRGAVDRRALGRADLTTERHQQAEPDQRHARQDGQALPAAPSPRRGEAPPDARPAHARAVAATPT